MAGVEFSGWAALKGRLCLGEDKCPWLPRALESDQELLVQRTDQGAGYTVRVGGLLGGQVVAQDAVAPGPGVATPPTQRPDLGMGQAGRRPRVRARGTAVLASAAPPSSWPGPATPGVATGRVKRPTWAGFTTEPATITSGGKLW